MVFDTNIALVRRPSGQRRPVDDKTSTGTSWTRRRQRVALVSSRSQVEAKEAAAAATATGKVGHEGGAQSMLLFLFASTQTCSSFVQSVASSGATRSDCDHLSCSNQGPGGVVASVLSEQSPKWKQKAAQRHSNQTIGQRRRRRGQATKWVGPLVRLLIFALLAHELHQELVASVQWSELQLTPLASSPQRQQLARTSARFGPGWAAGAQGDLWPSALSNLINWPGRPTGDAGRLQSMVVSLFAFPLCQANELVSQLGQVKDKAPGRLGQKSVELASAPAFASTKRVGVEPVEQLLETDNSKLEEPVETRPTNVATYNELEQRAKMPINLLARRAGQAAASSSISQAELASQSSTSYVSEAATTSPEPAEQLEFGQNNSNNTNNNETASRNLQSTPAGPTGRRSQIEAEQKQQQQQQRGGQLQQPSPVQTIGPKSGSYARDAKNSDGDLEPAYDPNSKGLAKAAVQTTASETTTTTASSGTKETKTAREEANLTMTSTGMSLAKKMRQKQQQQQQQQQHLTMTSKQRTAPMEKDNALPSSGRSGQLAALAEQQLDKSGSMNSVVCNSRCQCVQLEFVASQNGGTTTAFAANQTKQAESVLATVEDHKSGESVGGGGGRPKLIRPQRKCRAGETKLPQTTIEPSSPSVSTGSDTQTKRGQWPASKCDDDDDELAPVGRDQDAKMGDDEDEEEEEDLSGNRIALIEFGQDYSFDDVELDDGEPNNGNLNGAQATAQNEQTSEEEPADRSEQSLAGQTPNKLLGHNKTGPPTGNGLRHQQQQPPLPQHHHHHHHHEPELGRTTTKPTAEASDIDRTASATIKPAADDQSKVVNVTANAVAGPPGGAQPASRLMLSIKDNKTGPSTSSATGPLVAAGVSGDGGGAGGGAGAGASAPKAQVSLLLGPANVSGTDKAHLGRTRALPHQAAAQSADNFYPFLGDHHHLHQRHHLPDHQVGPTVAGLPFTDRNRRLHYGQSPAAVTQQQIGSIRQPDGKMKQFERQIKRILPLRSRTMKIGDNVDQMVDLLNEIEKRRIQSISLRSSGLKFELWTEIYGLLALELRQNLFHLDLARNDLVKLGVTFTGYIEHHLVYQLLVHNNQAWPFASLSQHTTGPAPTTMTATTNSTTTSPILSSSTTTTSSRRSQLRQPNLGSGKLYNQVRSRLPIEIDSLMLLLSNHNNRSELNKNQLKQHLNKFRQQQLPTVLHQPSRLKALDLSHNKLRWLINDQFRILKHVESIRLDYNQIRFIHQQAFNGLESLKYLNLNFNRLQTIYIEQFQTNYNLLALFMKSNYLTFLRAGSFASLNQLRRLDLSKNKFTYLSNNAFVGLDSLRWLNLSSNQFVHVPKTSFHSLAVSLDELDMSRNLLTQLTPGTFFHLKLKRISLEHNDQLAAIDRGAFWDLPYLSYLSLRSSPMLISINSQAFIGLPNLQTIVYDQCQLLDGDTRQMLDNITSATTLRLLKQRQQREDSNEELSLKQLATMPNEMQPLKLAAVNNKRQLASAERAGFGVGSNEGLDDEFELQQRQTKWTTKYVYSIACILLVVVVLKLLFKYTSTRHYLDMRRRRRRVYQTSASPSSASSPSSSSTCSVTQSPTAHSNHEPATTTTTHENIPADLNSCDISTDKCDSLGLDIDENDVGGDGGESFMMHKLQTGHNATATPSSSATNNSDMIQVDGGKSSQELGAPEIIGEVLQIQVFNVDENNVLGSNEFDLAEHQHQQQQQQQQQQQTTFSNCPDCCQSATNESNLDLSNGCTSQLPELAGICDSQTNGTNNSSAQVQLNGAERDGHQIATVDTSARDHDSSGLSSGQVGCSDENCREGQQLHLVNHHQAHAPQLYGVPFGPSQTEGPAGHQLASQWANQTDCRLFHCVCMRCVGTELVGVNGYI